MDSLLLLLNLLFQFQKLYHVPWEWILTFQLMVFLQIISDLWTAHRTILQSKQDERSDKHEMIQDVSWNSVYIYIIVSDFSHYFRIIIHSNSIQHISNVNYLNNYSLTKNQLKTFQHDK